MRYRITIRGLSDLICHNGAAGLDTRSAANQEKQAITKKRGSNRTTADEDRLMELDCQTSLYFDSEGQATIPAAMIRSNIETAARKLKQGPQVREGLILESIDEFGYDRDRYGTTVEELGRTTQFTTGVVVQRSRVLRTRAKFDVPWTVTFTIDTDEELIDQTQLENWLDIGGRRIGIGDWRPEKSGVFGRFETDTITTL